MDRRTLLRTVPAAIATAALPRALRAQEATLRLHQFLPPISTIPAGVLKPWGERLAAASDGRISVRHFDAMALGGRPPELLDQARDGVVDLSMSLVGYTPGRYPRSEVFELPFMMSDPVATSLAFWEMVETDFQRNEFADLKVLGAWVHGPGVIHTRAPLTRLEDMRGRTLRGPTRMITRLLGELGATPIGMPVPAVPEALSKGVIEGTVIPWEVTAGLRIAELVRNHTEFTGPEALYTATIVLAMNRARYASLPDELRAVVDAESGAKLSAFAAQVMQAADAPAREIAEKAGNAIHRLDAAEVARWKEASAPVVARWIEEQEAAGIDARALIARARALIAANRA
ncbi:TRAP transporter substrate-binding protein [Rubrimonas cliftonensis]|uniref:TRAP-type C4-dicarboxylate transport system, substrate-binding protein n=1 Tax=Rubrimonas cliftonensis TaxID=89524 RepID=A0A1H4DI82_9RHOB|nr:TRAP transporter substrate-binding protein [Rubrimonas cliftonensis]SEA72169.1 TRAP-type C4-dicarboxylate transport system, substrate-binding protein [Rubrimonas cliftonensis]